MRFQVKSLGVFMTTIAMFGTLLILDQANPSFGDFEPEVNPANGSFLKESIDQVSVTLSDPAGIDLNQSEIELSGPNELISGNQTHNGLDTLFLEFTPLRIDGSDDGEYEIRFTLVDTVNNLAFVYSGYRFTLTTTPPLLAAVTPEPGEAINTSLAQVVVRLEDQGGAGIDFAESGIEVVESGFLLDGVQGSNGVDTLFWTFANPLATDGSDDGVYTVTIVAVPNAGVSAIYSTDFIYDTTPPVVVETMPSPGEVLTESIVGVTATLADDNTPVDLTRSTLRLSGPAGDVPGRQTHNGVDTLQLTFDPLSSDGEYTLAIQPFDALGNTPATERQFKFLLDTTPPQVVSTMPASGATVVAPIDLVSARLNDEGAGVDLHQSTIRLISSDGVPIPGQRVYSGTTLFWELNAPLADDGSGDGVYTIEVEAEDQVGNRSPVLHFDFAYRTVQPLLMAVTPADGSAINTSIKTVTAQLQDQNGTGLNLHASSLFVEGPGYSTADFVSTDGVDTLLWTFANPLATDGSDDGVYTVTIVAVPNAGASAVYATLFTYDTTPPLVISTTPPANAILTAGISEVAAILTDAGTSVDVSRSRLRLSGPAGEVSGRQTHDGVDTIQLRFDPLSADGEYTLFIQPFDALGNTPATERRFKFLLDTTPPGVISTEPVAGETVVVPIDAVSVTLSDAGVGVDMQNSIIQLLGPDGIVAGGLASPADDILRWTLTQPLSANGTDDGVYEIIVEAIDLVGNHSSSLHFPFTYTSVEPEFPVGDVSGDGNVSAYDAALILRFVVGLIDRFPVEDMMGNAPENAVARDYEVSLPQVSLKAGRRVLVPVEINDATGLVAGGMAIQYDPTVLRAVNVTFPIGQSYWEKNTDLKGEVRFAFVNPHGATKTDKLLFIEFEALPYTEGRNSPLILDQVQLSESISIRKTDGLATVLPNKFRLHQNYPNPFNPETWIPYDLPADANVSISIFSTQGQRIRTLSSGIQPAGGYRTKDRAAYWDGRRENGGKVSSGVYFYQLQTETFSAIRKMVILK